MNASFWDGLFNAIGRGFDFFSGLLSRKPREEPPTEEPDAEAGRAGTAAGVAADRASHIAGPPECYLEQGVLKCIKCQAPLVQELSARDPGKVTCSKCGTVVNPMKRAAERPA